MNNITLIYNLYQFYNYSCYAYTGYQVYYYGNKTYFYLYPKNYKIKNINMSYLEYDISDNWIICHPISPKISEDYDIIDISELDNYKKMR